MLCNITEYCFCSDLSAYFSGCLSYTRRRLATTGRFVLFYLIDWYIQLRPYVYIKLHSFPWTSMLKNCLSVAFVTPQHCKPGQLEPAYIESGNSAAAMQVSQSNEVISMGPSLVGPSSNKFT